MFKSILPLERPVLIQIKQSRLLLQHGGGLYLPAVQRLLRIPGSNIINPLPDLVIGPGEAPTRVIPANVNGIDRKSVV